MAEEQKDIKTKAADYLPQEDQPQVEGTLVDSGNQAPTTSTSTTDVNPPIEPEKAVRLQKVGHISFDSNKARKIDDKFANTYIVKDEKTNREYGVVRKKDGSYTFYDKDNSDDLIWKVEFDPVKNVGALNTNPLGSSLGGTAADLTRPTKAEQEVTTTKREGTLAQSQFPDPNNPNRVKLGNVEFDFDPATANRVSKGYTNTYKVKDIKTGKDYQVLQRADGTFKFYNEQNLKDYGIPEGKDYAFGDLKLDGTDDPNTFDGKIKQINTELQPIQQELSALSQELEQKYGKDWTTKATTYQQTAERYGSKIQTSSAGLANEKKNLEDQVNELNGIADAFAKKTEMYDAQIEPLRIEFESGITALNNLAQEYETAKANNVGQGQLAALEARYTKEYTRVKGLEAQYKGIVKGIESDVEYKGMLSSIKQKEAVVKELRDAYNSKVTSILTPEEKKEYEDAVNYLNKIAGDKAVKRRNELASVYTKRVQEAIDLEDAKLRMERKITGEVDEGFIRANPDLRNAIYHRQKFGNLSPEKRKEIAEKARKSDEWYEEARNMGIDPRYIPTTAVGVPADMGAKINNFIEKNYPDISFSEQQQLQSAFALMYRQDRVKFDTFINPTMSLGARVAAETFAAGFTRQLPKSMDFNLTDTTKLNLRRTALEKLQEEVRIEKMLINRELLNDEALYADYDKKKNELERYNNFKALERRYQEELGETKAAKDAFLSILKPEERQFFENYSFTNTLLGSNPVVAEALKADATDLVLYNQGRDAIKMYPELNLAAIKKQRGMEAVTIQEGDSVADKVAKTFRTTLGAISNTVLRGLYDMYSGGASLGGLVIKAIEGTEGRTRTEESMVAAFEMMEPYLIAAELDPSESFEVDIVDGKPKFKNVQYALPELASVVTNMAMQIFLTRGVGAVGTAAGMGVRAAQTTGTIASTFVLGFTNDFQSAMQQGLSTREALAYTTVAGLLKGAVETVNIEGLSSFLASKSTAKMFSKFLSEAQGSYGEKLYKAVTRLLAAGGQEVPEEVLALFGEKLINVVSNQILGTSFETEINTGEILKTSLMAFAAGFLMQGLRDVTPGNLKAEKHMELLEASEYLMENEEDFRAYLDQQVATGQLTNALAAEMFDYVTQYKVIQEGRRLRERENLFNTGIEELGQTQVTVEPAPPPPVDPMEFAMRGDDMNTGETVAIEDKVYQVVQTPDGPVLTEKAKELDPEDVADVSTAYGVEVTQKKDGTVVVEAPTTKFQETTATTQQPDQATDTAVGQQAPVGQPTTAPQPSPKQQSQVEVAKEVMRRRGYKVDSPSQQQIEEGEYEPLSTKKELTKEDARELGKKPKGDRQSVPLNQADAVVYKGDEFLISDKNPDGSYEIENYSGTTKLSGIPASELSGVKVKPFEEVTIGKSSYSLPARKASKVKMQQKVGKAVKGWLVGQSTDPTKSDIEQANEVEAYVQSQTLTEATGKKTFMKNQVVDHKGRQGKVVGRGKDAGGNSFIRIKTDEGQEIIAPLAEVEAVKPMAYSRYEQHIANSFATKSKVFKTEDNTIGTEARQYFVSRGRAKAKQLDLIEQGIKFLKTMGIDVDVELHTTLESAKKAAIKGGADARKIKSYRYNNERVYDVVDNGDGTSTGVNERGETLTVPTSQLAEFSFGGVIVGGTPDNPKRTIVYSVETMNESTAVHEMFHPIIEALLGENPEILNNFFSQIKNTPDYKEATPRGRSLQQFVELYEDGMQAEEALVEFVARIASKSFDFNKSSTSFKAKIVRFFKKLFGQVGSPIEINTDNVLKFANGLATAFAENRAIKGYGPKAEMLKQPKVASSYVSPKKKVSQALRTLDDLVRAGEAELVNPQGKPCL